MTHFFIYNLVEPRTYYLTAFYGNGKGRSGAVLFRHKLTIHLPFDEQQSKKNQQSRKTVG